MNTTLVNRNLTAPVKAWNIGLWIAQVVLGIMFLMAGGLKLFTPIAQLQSSIPYAANIPSLIRFIGLSELLGGLGVLLPSLTRIRPQLAVIAAGALAFVMLLALIFHIVRGEISAIGINVALGALGTFVAWGRSRKAPIPPRS